MEYWTRSDKHNSDFRWNTWNATYRIVHKLDHGHDYGHGHGHGHGHDDKYVLGDFAQIDYV